VKATHAPDTRTMSRFIGRVYESLASVGVPRTAWKVTHSGTSGAPLCPFQTPSRLTGQTDPMANEVPYLQKIGDAATNENVHRLQEVKSAILRNGFWQEESEWRISTVTTFRIEPELADDQWWFKVTVTCDGEMICHTTTLERALQIMGVFDRLTMDMFWTLGWPSWAAKGRLDPEPGETTAGPTMS
jgi:hypothetical protein